MILQKALAKTYGSYFDLDNASPKDLIAEITGFFTKAIPSDQWISSKNNPQNKKGIFNQLQDLKSRGYMLLLEGK